MLPPNKCRELLERLSGGQRKLEKTILNNNENEAVCIGTIFH
jgi:hypothetical protein